MRARVGSFRWPSSGPTPSVQFTGALVLRGNPTNNKWYIHRYCLESKLATSCISATSIILGKPNVGASNGFHIQFWIILVHGARNLPHGIRLEPPCGLHATSKDLKADCPKHAKGMEDAESVRPITCFERSPDPLRGSVRRNTIRHCTFWHPSRIIFKMFCDII